MTSDCAKLTSGVHITEQEFSRFSAIVDQLTGIVIKKNRKAMVEARVSKLLRSLKISSLDQLCKLAESADGKIERDAIISTMTTNMTRFSREPHHFQFLREKIFPHYLHEKPNPRPMKVWSAGCSSGEEAYSAVFSFIEAASFEKLKKIQVLGTDIDPVVLSKAMAGVYDRQAVERVEGVAIDDYFESSIGGSITVKAEIKKRVRFKRLNLMLDHRFKSKFDVILCRNVAIYFSKGQQDSLWGMLVQNLNVGGFLIIGHSETLPHSSLLGMKQVSAGVFERCGDLILSSSNPPLHGGANSVA